jgi:hypothetical protein
VVGAFVPETALGMKPSPAAKAEWRLLSQSMDLRRNVRQRARRADSGRSISVDRIGEADPKRPCVIDFFRAKVNPFTFVKQTG